MASRVSIGSSFREVSENPRHGVPISNGEKTNDLPGKAPQGLPRELPESPGSVFSITVLEWVFSNQAARDGFREAPTRGNSGLRTKFVVFFSVALGTPKHGVPECLTTVIHLLRVCSSKDFPQSAHGWRTTSQHACWQRGQSLLARTQCMRPPSKVHKINRPRQSGGFALSLGGKDAIDLTPQS